VHAPPSRGAPSTSVTNPRSIGRRFSARCRCSESPRDRRAEAGRSYAEDNLRSAHEREQSHSSLAWASGDAPAEVSNRERAAPPSRRLHSHAGGNCRTNRRRVRTVSELPPELTRKFSEPAAVCLMMIYTGSIPGERGSKGVRAGQLRSVDAAVTALRDQATRLSRMVEAAISSGPPSTPPGRDAAGRGNARTLPDRCWHGPLGWRRCGPSG